jgi:hypothetical protein
MRARSPTVPATTTASTGPAQPCRLRDPRPHRGQAAQPHPGAPGAQPGLPVPGVGEGEARALPVRRRAGLVAPFAASRGGGGAQGDRQGPARVAQGGSGGGGAQGGLPVPVPGREALGGPGVPQARDGEGGGRGGAGRGATGGDTGTVRLGRPDVFNLARRTSFDQAGFEQAQRRSLVAQMLQRSGRGNSSLFRTGLLSTAAPTRRSSRARSWSPRSRAAPTRS